VTRGLDAPGRGGYTQAMDFPEFQSKISRKRAKVAPAYAFAGPEEFLRAEGERLVRRAALGEAEPELAAVVFDCPRNDAEMSRFDSAAVFEELTSFPLLVQKKVIVLRGADAFIGAHRAALEDWVAEPPGFAVLVIACEKLPKNTRLAKAIDSAGAASAGGYVECKRLYETEFGKEDVTPGAPLARWLAARAAERGVKIEADALCELIRRVGASLRGLDGALERLELAATDDGGGGGRPVTLAAVEAEFPYTRDYAAFKVLDMLDGSNVPGAIEVLRTLYRQGLPERGGSRTVRDARAISAILVSQLSRYLEQRLDACLALRRGMPPDEAARHAGMRGPRARVAMNWLGRTPPARLRYRVSQVLDAERALKGGSRAAPEIIVEGLLIRLSSKPEPASLR